MRTIEESIHIRVVKVAVYAVLILTSVGLFSVCITRNQVDAETNDTVSVPSSTLTNQGFEESEGEDAGAARGWNAFYNGYRRTSSQARSGGSSIEVSSSDNSSFSGAFQRLDINQTTAQPVFVSAYVKGQDIAPAPHSYFGASLYVEIHLRSGRVVYWNTVMNTGTFDWRWIGFNTGSISFINEPIAYMYVVPVLGQASGTAWFDDLSVREFSSYQSAVTLMFDDGNATDATVARPILTEYGFRGSTAIITGNIGVEEESMNINQIDRLHNLGWSIVSHTVSHSDLTQMSAAEVLRELQTSKTRLQNKGYGTESLALPYGAYNGEILGLAEQYYSSARAYELGDNPQGVFPYDIKVRSVTSNTTPAEVRAWISEAQKNNRWVVLVFHALTNEGDDAYHTSPEVFKKMIRVVSDSGISVVTYDEGIRMFAAPRP